MWRSSLRNHRSTLRCESLPFEGDPGIKPESHIFIGSKAPWHEINDNLPQFEEWPPDSWEPPSKAPNKRMQSDAATPHR